MAFQIILMLSVAVTVMSEQLEDGQTFLAEGDAGVCLRNRFNGSTKR